MKNKQRMLMAMRGKMPDAIPFAPPLDLWFSANRAAGTLPEKDKDCAHYFEIVRADGYAADAGAVVALVNDLLAMNE